ncbi:MAG: type II toxin-antitoxin system RelE/ParE family toxin [Hyphomicrobium aestuarii]|nr:type II toxin-antitoxin system RelE/ParE family toxin [Hyphomicrobium aestuarii]
MIESFRSKALERFWWKDEPRRVAPHHVKRLTLVLSLLDAANEPAGMDIPGLAFHPLEGDQAGRYAVRVDGNWRVTFRWSLEGNAAAVDYEDYH